MHEMRPTHSLLELVERDEPIVWISWVQMVDVLAQGGNMDNAIMVGVISLHGQFLFRVKKRSGPKID